MRRYTFAEMGVKDHEVLFGTARSRRQTRWRACGAWLRSTPRITPWRGPVSIDRSPEGRLESRCEAAIASRLRWCPRLSTITSGARTSRVESELRTIDDRMIISKWTTDIRGPYAKLLRVGTQGLFYPEQEKGSNRRFTLYTCSRAQPIDRCGAALKIGPPAGDHHHGLRAQRRA
jgi:hypothetical protein